MDPLIGQSLMGAGAGLADGLFGIYGQRKANEKNMELMLAQRGWNQQDWIRNRQWDKAAWDKQNKYNLDMWNMQNEYNSPKAQMERFGEAGLNPHLIYGKGTAGPAGQVAQSKPATAGDVKGTSIPNMQSTTRGFNAFKDIYNVQNTQAQTNNIKAQTNVNNQEAILKAIQAANASITGKSLGLKYKLDSALYDTNITAAQENVRKLIADANVATDTQQDRTKLVSQQVRKLALDIKGQKTENKKKIVENRILEIQRNLNEQGVFKSDNMIYRQIATEKGLSYFKNFVKSLLKKNFKPLEEWSSPF